LVTMAKLVVAIFKPIFDRVEARRALQRRREMVTMPAVPIADARPRARVKIAGVVEPAAACRRGVAVFVRDAAGARVLVQPAAAAGVWCSLGSAGWKPAAGERVGVVGVPRAADAAIDRELEGEGEVRLVFAGSEVDPLFITRLAAA
jgi:hypothetical protein